MSDIETISQFLARHSICVLSVVMPDRTSHSSVMHYSHSANPFVIYFSTDIKSKKCLPLLGHQSAQASVAIGFSEDEWLTLQLSGSLRVIYDDEHLTPQAVSSIKSVHYTKHPASAKYADNPGTVFLELIPSWWRYTDFSQRPPLIIES